MKQDPETIQVPTEGRKVTQAEIEVVKKFDPSFGKLRVNFRPCPECGKVRRCKDPDRCCRSCRKGQGKNARQAQPRGVRAHRKVGREDCTFSFPVTQASRCHGCGKARSASRGWHPRKEDVVTATVAAIPLQGPRPAPQRVPAPAPQQKAEKCWYHWNPATAGFDDPCPTCGSVWKPGLPEAPTHTLTKQGGKWVFISPFAEMVQRPPATQA